jgi:hypothetical protein
MFWLIWPLLQCIDLLMYSTVSLGITGSKILTWAQCYKTIFGLNSLPLYKARVFARLTAYTIEEHYMCSTLGLTTGIGRKQYTRLERHVRDKHSSLFRKLVTYDRKKFYNIGFW